MKKILAMTLALILVLGLCACAAAKADEESADSAASVGVKNPMREVTKEEMDILMSIPEGAEDVHYFIYETGDTVLYETRFTLNGKQAYTRAQATAETEPFDFSGLNYSFDVSEGTVNEKPAKFYVCDDCAFAAWIDVVPGAAFIAAYNEPANLNDIMVLASICGISLQGEVG